ncbi:hypothetical protein VNO77_40372 [Canavalia gladiata]|uniref:Uncharacterized protein n=1 Tax=Canavalia gladiata TaxID=3824 RepID=A0AAN9PPK0_CANGL
MDGDGGIKTREKQGRISIAKEGNDITAADPSSSQSQASTCQTPQVSVTLNHSNQEEPSSSHSQPQSPQLSDTQINHNQQMLTKTLNKPIFGSMMYTCLLEYNVIL